MNSKNIFIVIIAGVVMVGSLFFFLNSRLRSLPKTEEKPETAIANPASVNCGEKGGKLEIAKKSAGGEYGICIFADNRQCEEWALFRAECPEGGVKITGFTTEAQKYCAITGGSFTPDGQNPDKGECRLFNGAVCDADDYYNDKCGQSIGQPLKQEQTEIKAVFACKDDKTIETVFSDNKVSLTLSDGRKLDLNQAMSASGARYANQDESFVFWNKGDTAFIEEKGLTTFADCLQK